MDTYYDDTSKKVESTYKNILDDLGPSIKQLVVAGRTYLKSIHGMTSAHRHYNEALVKVASLAENSMQSGSCDMGAAIRHVAKVNKEMLAQQSNLIKSLEFDFLEPMEIAADKDTKLIGRERKRFQQLQKTRKEDFEKNISTLKKKTRRKKSFNSDQHITQIRIMENSKTRLEEFCDESLREAVVQERILYGTILEKLCTYSKQALIYHNKGIDLLQSNLPKWESLAETKDILPNNYIPHYTPSDRDVYSIYTPSVEGSCETNSIQYDMYRSNHAQTIPKNFNNTATPSSSYHEPSLHNYGRDGPVLTRAKSEHNIYTNSYAPIPVKLPVTPPFRLSGIMNRDDDDESSSPNYVRALYAFVATGEHQMTLSENDIIQFVGGENGSGWQFGDNITTKKSGWFPLSYTERIEKMDDLKNTSSNNKWKRDSGVGLASYSESASLSEKTENPEITDDYGALQLPLRKNLHVNSRSALNNGSQQRKSENIYENVNAYRSALLTEQGGSRDSTTSELRYFSNIPLQSMHL